MKVKLPIWLPTIKIRNHLNLLTCRWHDAYCWQALDEGYNFALDLTLIGSLHKKLWASKIVEYPISKNLVQGLWPSIKNIIKGKAVASPKSRPWWILWFHVCSWLIHAPKMLQLRTNQFVVWFVQVHVNNWPTCHSS